MNMKGNTILITGGGSGIGRALAEAFHRLGNRVVIAGRSLEKLNEVTAANPGMRAVTVDMTRGDSIRSMASQVLAEFPQLNVVIHNAGIMRPEDILNQKEPLDDVEATIATNLTGPIRLTAALLPALRKQPQAAILTVSSGLAFIPMAMTPTYCATKAAIHSWTQSLRYQLRDTSVQVIELVPPYVQTTLMGDHQKRDPEAMPLEEYIAETMDLLTTQHDLTEVLVKRVLPLRFAEVPGQAKYAQMFKGFNDAVSSRRREAAR